LDLHDSHPSQCTLMPFRSLDQWNDLTLAQRAEIQARIDAFVRAWHPEKRPPIADYLPSDPNTRDAALFVLIQADLERRLEAGESTEVEAYLADFPEIAQNPNFVLELIAAERALRRKRGEAVSIEAYQLRFAALRDELAQRLGKDEVVSPEDKAAQRTTVTQSSGQDTGWQVTNPTLPERFGRYHVVRSIGRGGMGTVYLAEDTQLGRHVALKTPTLQEDRTSEFVERFYREARTAGGLNHPNICPVYDVGQIDGVHYISMAFVEGHPLSDLVGPDRPSTVRQILIMICKVAHALQEAHNHGIVHRDLKPSNIMIDASGEPLVMDFGLARRIYRDGEMRLTQSNVILGSPAYMSPEQVQGDQEKIGPASDQYSLGVVLYELLVGQLPFHGSLVAMMGLILTRQPTPPKQLRPDLDPRLESACLKMMAKNPNERFPSLSAAANELATLLTNSDPGDRGVDQIHGTRNADAAAMRRQRKWFANRRRFLIAACGAVAGVTVLIVAAGIAISLRASKVVADRSHDPIVETRDLLDSSPRKRVKLPPALSHEVRVFQGPDAHANFRCVAFSPDSMRIASGLDNGIVMVWGAIDLHETHSLKGNFVGVNCVAFSPDGRWIVSGGDDQTVEVWDTRNGKEAHALLEHRRAISCVAFSPDGKHIASGSLDTTIKIWSMTSDHAILTLRGHTNEVVAVAFSPDGKLIASASRLAGAAVKVWDATSGHERCSHKLDGPNILGTQFSADAERILGISSDGAIKVWNTVSGKVTLSFKGADPILTFGGPGPLALSRDGKRIASAGRDGTIRVWDATTGRQRCELKGHQDDVLSLAFSPDGKHIASGGTDGAVRVWDATSVEPFDGSSGASQATSDEPARK
jgi:WD40 repeat protein/predicted Ser/Thr protein kinase